MTKKRFCSILAIHYIPMTFILITLLCLTGKGYTALFAQSYTLSSSSNRGSFSRRIETPRLDSSSPTQNGDSFEVASLSPPPFPRTESDEKEIETITLGEPPATLPNDQTQIDLSGPMTAEELSTNQTTPSQNAPLPGWNQIAIPAVANPPAVDNTPIPTQQPQPETVPSDPTTPQTIDTSNQKRSSDPVPNTGSTEAASSDQVPAGGHVVVVVPQDTKTNSTGGMTEEEKKESEKTAVFVSITKTPRRAFSFFMEAGMESNFEQMVKMLDFSTLPGLSEMEKQDLAYKLHSFILRITEPDPENLPEDATLEGYRYQPNADYPPIFLVLKDGAYVFNADTVEQIDSLYEQVKNLRPLVFNRYPILRSIPDWWFHSMLGLRRIQWVYLLIIGLITYVVGFVFSRILYVVTLTTFNIVSSDLSEYKVSKKTWRPLGWYLSFLLFYFGMLGAKIAPKFLSAVGHILGCLAYVMVLITLFRLIDIISLWGKKKLEGHKSRLDEILVPLLSRSAKIIAAVIMTICLFQSFGFSAIGIVSGMGIGGIAIALAAQNTIANLFGSITVLMDRPFVIGDWIVTNNIEGQVESVGLRSTRIRTFYNSLVSIPNNILTTATIDNMGRRHFRRYKTTLGVQYDTPPDRIEAFCEGIRELILSYNFTRKDVFYVNAYEFSASSIDILLNCFFLVKDTAGEHQARNTLILDILRLANEMDVRFAFPTQTIYNVASEDKAYEEPDGSIEEFGRSSAAKIIDRRASEERRHRAIASGNNPQTKQGLNPELLSFQPIVHQNADDEDYHLDALSRKTEEILKKRKFLRRAG